MYQNKTICLLLTDVMPSSCGECICSESSCNLPMKEYPHHDEIKKAFIKKRHPNCPLLLKEHTQVFYKGNLMEI